MSLEQLMDVEVTSVSRYPQAVRDAAAAVSVLSRAEIRRAGVTTIPDALRLVPGVQVAQIGAGAWAVSARGFNAATANKLLVMIDGRSIYTPFFSGVVWDRHDLVLDNIERIEVVRGPGGAIWGANAVNGVINIITRDSAATQGSYARLTSGTVDRAIAEMRHGGRLGGGTARVSAKARRRKAGERVGGGTLDDAWTLGQLSFRADTPALGGDLMVSGGARRSEVNTEVDVVDPATAGSRTALGANETTLGHVTGRWSRTLAAGGRVQVQGSYDHTALDSTLIGIDRDRLDLHGQHRLAPRGAHELIWGLRFRAVRESIRETPTLGVRDDTRVTTRLSAFAQDTIALTETLDLILGGKLSRNIYTGVEVQPNVRASWRVAPRHTLWGAVSRAVRTPSRVEADGDFAVPTNAAANNGAPVVPVVRGTDDVDASSLIAYELGYRGRPSPDTRLAVSAFFNDHDDLIGTRRVGTSAAINPQRVEVVSVFDNTLSGTSAGVEVEGTWQVAPAWRLTAGYSFIELDVDGSGPDGRAQARDMEGRTPAHQGALRSRWRVRDDLRVDTTLRAVDELPAANVPAYVQLDARVAWELAPDTTLEVSGRNLLEAETTEFRTGAFPGFATTRAERSVFASLEVRF
ncbi:TonB-dependent receptor plug domain-containing protein [Limimonas halophila]|nr:TonB-dependent receptor [Limimonas halophila]